MSEPFPLTIFSRQPVEGVMLRRGADGRAVFTAYPSGDVLSREEGMSRVGMVDADEGDDE